MDDRSGRIQAAQAATHSRSVVQCYTRRETERNDRVITDDLTPARFGRTLMLFAIYLPATKTVSRQETADDKGRLQVGLPPNPPSGGDGPKGLHSDRRHVVSGAATHLRGAPNPSQWSDVSEVVVDLANDLVRRDDWYPRAWIAPQQYLLDSARPPRCPSSSLRRTTDRCSTATWTTYSGSREKRTGRGWRQSSPSSFV